MKYETPQMTTLTPAINVIHSLANKQPDSTLDGVVYTEGMAAYADWE
jgi:hypothetical protein